MPMITVAAVRSEQQARAVIADKAKWERACGAPVVPMIPGSALFASITRLWTSLGIEWTCVARPSASPNRPTNVPRQVLLNLPAYIAATDGVDSWTRAFTEAITGRPVHDVSTLMHHVVANGEAEASKTVMLLMSLDHVTSQVLTMCDELTRRGARLGVVPVAKGASGRYAVLKATTTAGALRFKRYRMLTNAAEGDDEHAPSSFVPPQRATFDSPADDLDLLVLAGHSNPWHVVINPNVVLCSRHARQRRIYKSAIPCFNGAGCPVQGAHGRDAFQTDG
jgi:hypothetical protein